MNDSKPLACCEPAGNESAVTDPDRKSTLSKFESDLSRSIPARRDATTDSAVSWDEIAFLAEGLAFGPRALHAATARVTERYDLGPRGAWILNVISHGIAYPLELSLIFRVGRSLITAELSRLTEAGLIDARPGKDDRRKTELTLTPLGQEASAEIRAELSTIFKQRLTGFSAEEIRRAAEVLRALGREAATPPSQAD